MQTESARMTTAEEARYRINYPNSSPRAVKVVALDPPSEAVVKRLAQGSWQRATFFTAPKIEGTPKQRRPLVDEGVALRPRRPHQGSRSTRSPPPT